MSLSSANNRNDYVGNGATSVYAYTFKVFANTQLKVTKNVSGTETVLALTTDYTVSGVGSASGGNITLVAGNLPSGVTLTIQRNLSIVQETEFRNLGEFYPESHEDQFDRTTMIQQQEKERVDRAVKLPDSIAASVFDTTLPTDIETADAVLAVNPTGDGFVMGPTISTISGASASAAAAAASAAAAAASATAAQRTVFGTRASPRTVVAATGITAAASHMSTTANRQLIFVQGDGAGLTDISANPQIQAGTIVGQEMLLIQRSSSAQLKLDDGDGLLLNGTCILEVEGQSITLVWDGTTWCEESRNN